jgi:hypothetical protein
MTKVTTAAGAFAFDPAVPLLLQRDPIRFDRLPERRPSGPAVVLPGRGEEGRAAVSARRKGEYIYPAILVSLPMVVRAATLALRDLKTCPVDGPQFAPIRLRLPLDDGQELFDTGGESVDRVVQCGPIRSRARGGLVLFLSLNMSTMSPEYIIDEGRFL